MALGMNQGYYTLYVELPILRIIARTARIPERVQRKDSPRRLQREGWYRNSCRPARPALRSHHGQHRASTRRLQGFQRRIRETARMLISPFLRRSLHSLVLAHALLTGSKDGGSAALSEQRQRNTKVEIEMHLKLGNPLILLANVLDGTPVSSHPRMQKTVSKRDLLLTHERPALVA